MLHRVKEENDVNKDKWVGVGGHFEETESPYDCVIREVFEETGFALTEASYRAVITFVSDLYPTEQMHLFTSSGFVGEMISCDEGDLCWVKKEDVPALPLWEGDKIFLALLERKKEFFSLKLSYVGDTLVSAVLDGIPLEKNKNGEYAV